MTKLLPPLNSPFFDHQVPLALGWSDEQLQPVVEVLVSLLPFDLTASMAMAVASCAASLTAETHATGSSVHYSRNRNDYSIPLRYRHDPRYTYHFVVGAMDTLVEAGLVEHWLGMWAQPGAGMRSVARPTQRLLGALDGLVEGRTAEAVETIVLRDAQGREIDYSDNDETLLMRTQLEIINEELGKLELLDGEAPHTVPVARRIFNGTFSRGGRLYCAGSSHQNMPKAQRQALRIAVDGQAQPMVEIDYPGLHPAMTYRMVRRSMPKGDPYAIEGFHRPLVKMGFNTLLNAKTRSEAVGAITEELHTHGTPRREGRIQAKDLVKAILRKHRPIAHLLGSDRGAKFQKIDSEMAVQVCLQMITRTGRCPLPVHDSFLVAESDSDHLLQVMSSVAASRGLYLFQETSSSDLSSTQSFPVFYPLEDTSSKQGKQRGLKEPETSLQKVIWTAKTMRAGP